MRAMREPEGTKSSGLREAFKEPKGNKVEKGRPSKGRQPSLKSDGMKTAAKGESMKASKLAKTTEAKKKVR
jgi:hypothetical protein